MLTQAVLPPQASGPVHPASPLPTANTRHGNENDRYSFWFSSAAYVRAGPCPCVLPPPPVSKICISLIYHVHTMPDIHLMHISNKKTPLVPALEASNEVVPEEPKSAPIGAICGQEELHHRFHRGE